MYARYKSRSSHSSTHEKQRKLHLHCAHVHARAVRPRTVRATRQRRSQRAALSARSRASRRISAIAGTLICYGT